MSRAYKCDCCGKLFESYLEEGKIKQVIVTENISKLNSKDEKISYDVCKECFMKIKKILNQNAKKVQSDKKPDCFGTYDERHKCKNSGCKLKKECIETAKEDKDCWDDSLLED